MYKIAIVGLGPAGIFSLALLPEVLLPDVVVFEPHTIGGDLATYYGNVIANITKEVIASAFNKIPRWTGRPLRHLEKYADEQCPLLIDTVHQMREFIADDLKKVTFIAKKVTEFRHTAQQTWQLKTSEDKLFEAQKVFLCTGGQLKTMDLPLMSVPLTIALNPPLLSSFIRPNAKIVVFGTSHSGTIVMKNLKNLECRDVTVIWRGKKLFKYLRDGESEGLKQESAIIADEILAKAWGEYTPKFVHYDELATMFKVLQGADLVIYATGFLGASHKYITPEGVQTPLQFNPKNSQFDGVPNIWGFGMAYPTTYTSASGTFADVGYSPFIDAISAALPAVL